jgi:hypothetical protein
MSCETGQAYNVMEQMRCSFKCLLHSKKCQPARLLHIFALLLILPVLEIHAEKISKNSMTFHELKDLHNTNPVFFFRKFSHLSRFLSKVYSDAPAL